MSDETYYTVLTVKETATLSEIKTAYRDLIKQVHPDTIANLAPYLRRLAEEKAKEITEAYSVLSNSSKRRDYDRQLAEYRRQNAPQAPRQQAPPPQAPPQSQPHHTYTSSAAPRQKKGYSWAPLRGWAEKHPLMLIVFVLFIVVLIGVFSDDSKPIGGAGTVGAQNKSDAQIASDYAARIHTQDPKPVPAPPPGFEIVEPSAKTAQSAPKQQANVPVTVTWARTHGLKAEVKTKEDFCAADATRESDGTREEEEGYCASPLLYWEDFVKTQRIGGSVQVKSLPRTTVTSFGAVEGPCCKLAVIKDYSQLQKHCAFSTGTFPCGVGADEDIAVLHKGDLLTLLEPICKRTTDGRHACHVKVNEGGWVGYVDERLVEIAGNE